MAPWEDDGWAIQPSAKRKLATRKLTIQDLRRKIGVAAHVKP